MNRRTFLVRSAAATAASLIPGGDVLCRRSHARQAITIDSTPRFEILPYLYVQFMETLGVTDGSVETLSFIPLGRVRPLVGTEIRLYEVSGKL